MASSSSSSSFFHIEPLLGGETRRRAMDACSLCGKRLAPDHDIFMYRGDTPFCSEECRYDQMVRDEMAAGRSIPLRTEQERHRHQTPAAATETARVQIAANVPVAI